MTKLYLANATRQQQEIHLRLPERASPLVHRIPPGTQIKVGVDLTTMDVDAVLKQGKRYGWKEASETNRNWQSFAGIIYSLDKPVPRNRTEAAMEGNVSVLKKRGKETRDLAAVSTHAALEAQLAETGVANLTEADIEIVEEDKPGSDNAGDRIAEGRAVSRTAPREQTATGNRRERERERKRD